MTLECTEAKAEGASPSRYTTQKVRFSATLCQCSAILSPHTHLALPLSLSPLQNKKNTPERMELMKYNPFLKRHTLHKEIK